MGKTITNWEYSTETEALRLIHCAHQISIGFYSLNGFVLVPYSYRGNKIDLVTLPDLDYHSIPRFWDRVRKTNVKSVPVVAPKKFVKEVAQLMLDADISSPDFYEIKAVWERAEQPFLDSLYALIPSLKKSIRSINIYPTKFGTGASFNLNKKTIYPTDIFIYLREDADIYKIAGAILLSVTRSKVFSEYKGLWSESQVLVDWIVGETFIYDTLRKFQKERITSPSMHMTRSYVSKEVLDLSEAFYKKLGVKHGSKRFSISSNNKILIDNSAVKNLTHNEFKVLSLLIKNRGELVKINQIADTLFADDDEFSLYAISKNIERVRKKLEFNGVTGSYIQTVRGEGFLLRV